MPNKGGSDGGGHVARMGELRNAYRILVGTSVHKWDNNITWILHK